MFLYKLRLTEVIDDGSDCKSNIVLAENGYHICQQNVQIL